jgi:hypothetical protein
MPPGAARHPAMGLRLEARHRQVVLHLVAAFRKGLSEIGFVEGRNVTIGDWANRAHACYVAARTIKLRHETQLDRSNTAGRNVNARNCRNWRLISVCDLLHSPMNQPMTHDPAKSHFYLIENACEKRRMLVSSSSPQASEMQISTGEISAVISVKRLDPSRTPMWAFGHTNLGDRWIPVALPPPAYPRPTFSAGLRTRRNPQ